MNRTVLILFLCATLGLSACAGSTMSTQDYPKPRLDDLPIGIEQGLISPGWDGGNPLRLVAFLVHPVGVAADLIINQPVYFLASQAPDLFGYTYQDAVYRESVLKYRYHWLAPSR